MCFPFGLLFDEKRQRCRLMYTVCWKPEGSGEGSRMLTFRCSDNCPVKTASRTIQMGLAFDGGGHSLYWKEPNPLELYLKMLVSSMYKQERDQVIVQYTCTHHFFMEDMEIDEKVVWSAARCAALDVWGCLNFCFLGLWKSVYKNFLLAKY